MASIKSVSSGVQYGLIAGLIYVVLLLLQYTYAATNPITFAAFKFITYLVIIAVFVFAGLARRKEMGGYGDFKTILQAILVTITITEIIYGIFSYVYLNYINPQFLDNFINNTMIWLEKKKIPQEQIDQQMEMYRTNTTKPTIANTLFGVAVWIIVDSIFGLIIAAALKKNRPPFENSFNQ